MLSLRRHQHLVSLIGYYDENGEKILIYEYLVKDTIKSHLTGTLSLGWKERLQICIGAVRVSLFLLVFVAGSSALIFLSTLINVLAVPASAYGSIDLLL